MPFKGIDNERELLLQIAQGDRLAFKILYTAYFPHVQQYVSLFGPGRDSLDELTQDVFVRIWEKRARLEGVESLKGYIFLITRNVVFNFIRAMRVRQREQELDESTEVVSNDLEHDLLFRQYYRLAQEAMEKLPTGRRKVLKMSIDDGLTLDEIAEQLNITRAGVKKQLYAATAFVRQYLQEHGEMTLLLFVFLSLFEL
ncbi:MAG TPA: sigma-70 family RNA polymerase sigma factor [Puia sp.]